jgi:hypothetical protein
MRSLVSKVTSDKETGAGAATAAPATLMSFRLLPLPGGREAATVCVTSSMVFHCPHPGQRPNQPGDW